MKMQISIITGSVFLILIKCAFSAPQYFSDRCFLPMYVRENFVYPTLDKRQVYPFEENWMSTYPEKYIWPNPWFNLEPYSLSMVPPVHEETKFTSENANELQRGRSDIDPDEDNEELGYFYPKPKVTFNLPNFTPLGGTSDTEVTQAATIGATTQTDEDVTEKATTVSSPETNPSKI